jgi:eukaryotic translation initiation factor 2C
LPNQPYRGKLSANQTRAMIDIACLAPSINQAEIYRNGLPQMGIQPVSDALTRFGISLGTQMAVVPGRILDPPKVAYADRQLQIKDSAWNLRDVQFRKGAKIGPCVAVVMNERRGDFDNPEDQELARVRWFNSNRRVHELTCSLRLLMGL